jgi:FtsH-binding integral membrane protein
MDFRQRDIQSVSFNQVRGSVLSVFMSRVYAWMMLGICVTGLVSLYVGSQPDLVARIFNNKPFFWSVVIVQLLSVIYLTAMVNRISASAAAVTFLAYSGLTGLTLSMIFVLYTSSSIASVFAITAFAFGGLSLYGYTTKRDLGPIGSFCVMALFGMIGFMLLSFFVTSLRSDGMQMGISALGLLIFAGLTAYDTQRIKNLAITSEAQMNQQAIFGALILYLDFLNLFLNLLRLMGQRR